MCCRNPEGAKRPQRVFDFSHEAGRELSNNPVTIAVAEPPQALGRRNTLRDERSAPAAPSQFLDLPGRVRRTPEQHAIRKELREKPHDIMRKSLRTFVASEVRIEIAALVLDNRTNRDDRTEVRFDPARRGARASACGGHYVSNGQLLR